MIWMDNGKLDIVNANMFANLPPDWTASHARRRT